MSSPITKPLNPLNTLSDKEKQLFEDTKLEPVSSAPLFASDENPQSATTPIKEDKTISLTMGCFMLVKSAVGIGALYLAGAYASIGYVQGLFIMFVVSFFSGCSLYFLARSSARTGVDSYYGLGRLAYGRLGERLVVLATMLYLLGALIAYAAFAGAYVADLVRAASIKGGSLAKWAGDVSKAPVPLKQADIVATLKSKGITVDDDAFISDMAHKIAIAQAKQDKARYIDSLTGIVTNPWYQSLTVLLVSGVAILPLAMSRDLKKLSKLSIAGMVCVGYITVLTLVDYLVDLFNDPKILPKSVPRWTLDKPSGIFVCIAKMVFAFANHFTIVSIVPKLENGGKGMDSSAGRRKTMVLVSQVATTLIYLAISLTAFFHFPKVEGDLLNNKVNWWYMGGKAAIAATIVLSYPLLLDPARSAAMFLLSKKGTEGQGRDSNTRFYLVTIAFVTVSALVGAFAFDQVSPIMDIFTSLAGAALAFVFPALYFMKLGQAKAKSEEQEIEAQVKNAPFSYYEIKRVERVVAWITLGLGLIVVIIGTGVAIKDMITGIQRNSLKEAIKSILYSVPSN